MKKITLLIAIAICSISSYAQFSYGIQAGANLGLGHDKNEEYVSIFGTDVKNRPRVGFMVGMAGNFAFGKIAFRPEFNYIQKGSKTVLYGGQQKISLNYIEVPLNIMYNIEVAKAGKLFFGLGPAIAFGFGGKVKAINDSTESYSIDVEFDGEKNPSDYKYHLKEIDLGANILAGFQASMGLFVKMGFTCGLTNVYPNKSYVYNKVSYKQSYKNNGISLCVGYMFWGFTKKK